MDEITLQKKQKSLVQNHFLYVIIIKCLCSEHFILDSLNLQMNKSEKLIETIQKIEFLHDSPVTISALVRYYYSKAYNHVQNLIWNEKISIRLNFNQEKTIISVVSPESPQKPAEFLSSSLIYFLSD